MIKTRLKPINKRWLLWLIGGFFLSINSLAFFSAVWYIGNYGQVGFDGILFTLFSGVDGVGGDLMLNYLFCAFLPALFSAAGLIFLLYFFPKKPLLYRGKKKTHKLYPFSVKFSILLTVVFSAAFLSIAAFCIQIPQYVYGMFHSSTLYEDAYVDPSETDICFPDQKRNLIYIVLESMETTFLSQEKGGGVKYDLIPELYDLAACNLNFSHNNEVGGALEYTGTSWTIASFVSQTAGIPLKLPIEVDEDSYWENRQFLPNATTLIDILDTAGYYQTLMVGSDGNFGGRKQYYLQHGADKVYDLFTARQDGVIPPDYYVWWGMEDRHLFTYAKQELSKIADRDQPFAFTLLTVDTHHIDGYRCDLCQDTYAQQYENVLACSSCQVASFVNWIQQQDFYQNTTIVITGDHNTMDANYISKNVDLTYERHIYNCFINSAATPKQSKNRDFSMFDMFPTTLAALGCELNGSQYLGLGVNLFSDQPTLAEIYGKDEFDKLLNNRSDFYNEKFLY